MDSYEVDNTAANNYNNFVRRFLYTDGKPMDTMDWYDMCKNQLLTENFIRTFQDKVHWPSISRFQVLSEGFIREFKDKINWGIVSGYQKMSEDFIEEFADLVDWSSISLCQRLSKEFIVKHIDDRIKLSCVLMNTNISDDVKEELGLATMYMLTSDDTELVSDVYVYLKKKIANGM